MLEISIGQPIDKIIHVCDRGLVDGKFNPSGSTFYTQNFIDDCIEGTLKFRDLVSRPPTPQHDFNYDEFRFFQAFIFPNICIGSILLFEEVETVN